MPNVKPIPDGYHSVTPYLTFKDANAAIQWYTKAFGAAEIMRLPSATGGVGHAELQIGGSRIMMADESPEMGNKSCQTLGGSPVSFMLYVEDVDSAFPKALAAGATERRPLADQFYGDRSGTLVDPFGLMWTLGTHIEDVTEEEMEARMRKLYPSK